MWLYKLCKIHDNKKNYTVVGRFEDKGDAEHEKKVAEFYDNYKHKFEIKRYSGEPSDIF